MSRAILNTPVQEAQVRVLYNLHLNVQKLIKSEFKGGGGVGGIFTPFLPVINSNSDCVVVRLSMCVFLPVPFADGGTPFSAMRAEEIFRQFFGDFDLGSMFGNQGFGGASSTHQVG